MDIDDCIGDIPIIDLLYIDSLFIPPFKYQSTYHLSTATHFGTHRSKQQAAWVRRLLHIGI